MGNLHTLLNTSHDDWYLRDQHGEYITLTPSKQKIFDFTVPGMRRAWLEVLSNASRSGVIDGCYLDKGNSTYSNPWKTRLSASKYSEWIDWHVKVQQEAQKMFPSGLALSNGGYYQGVKGMMFESFGHHFHPSWNYLLSDLHVFQSEARKGGKIIQV